MSSKAEIRRRITARMGRYDKYLKRVLLVNTNGYKGRSQKGCFGGTRKENRVI